MTSLPIRVRLESKLRDLHGADDVETIGCAAVERVASAAQCEHAVRDREGFERERVAVSIGRRLSN